MFELRNLNEIDTMTKIAAALGFVALVATLVSGFVSKFELIDGVFLAICSFWLFDDVTKFPLQENKIYKVFRLTTTILITVWLFFHYVIA